MKYILIILALFVYYMIEYNNLRIDGLPFLFWIVSTLVSLLIVFISIKSTKSLFRNND